MATVGERVAGRRVVRIDGATREEEPDSVAVEEPLEIRLGRRPLTVTMRTPGDDIELALGWLVAEGSIVRATDVLRVRERSEAREDGPSSRSVEIDLGPAAVPPTPRSFLTTSACGVCGTDAIDTLRTRAWVDLSVDDCRVEAGLLTSLPDRLRDQQSAFARSGGVHAAGLYTSTGELMVVREDVGRHNAVDKVVGWALQQDRLPLRNTVLQVSGRASFELVAKAVAAGIPILSAISAPSSLAVDLAREADLTLAGFVRGTRANLYSAPRRVVGEAAR
jgi:FdhD protein